MRITWVTRSFLDYRIPVFEELDRLSGNNLTVIYNSDVVPERCKVKLKQLIGDRALGLTGEIRFVGEKIQPLSSTYDNKIRIPFQPGLINEILKCQPEILISDGFFQWTYASLWLRLCKKVPHVMCYEGTKHTERNNKFFRTTYRKIATKYIDWIICNGTLCSEYIQDLGYSKAKVSVGNMTADIKMMSKKTHEFSLAERLRLKREIGLNRLVFLFVGRLVPLKGIELLINIWIKIFGKNNEVSLLIVGDGPERKKLENMSRSHDLDNVQFLGLVDYELIHQYFTISDVFVIPTLHDNWSLVVPEAMSCSLPIMSSKYNGCWPELVKPENGWVFDPLDEESFASILKRAWDNRANWKQMGTESLRIVQDYSPEKIVTRIYDVCSKVLNG